jgi:hypothetical protein
MSVVINIKPTIGVSVLYDTSVSHNNLQNMNAKKSQKLVAYREIELSRPKSEQGEWQKAYPAKAR